MLIKNILCLHCLFPDCTWCSGLALYLKEVSPPSVSSIRNEFDVHFRYTHRNRISDSILYHYTSVETTVSELDFTHLNQTRTGKENKGSHSSHSSTLWCNYCQQPPSAKHPSLFLYKFAVPSPQGSVPAEQTFPTRAAATEDHGVSPWSPASHNSHIFPPPEQKSVRLWRVSKWRGRGREGEWKPEVIFCS